MHSPLLVWVHLAPVCGTASRARDIQQLPSDPKPLRSCDYPEGLPDLTGIDAERVLVANELFSYACHVFHLACQAGKLATMENPSRSHFWQTIWVRRLLCAWELFFSDFQMCMFGGSADQRQVWATSLESKYPRMCLALVQIVLQLLHARGVALLPESLQDISTHPLLKAQSAKISTGLQPRGRRVPPIVTPFSSTQAFQFSCLQDVPCPIGSKLTHELACMDLSGCSASPPAHSRFLRFGSLPPPAGGVPQESEGIKAVFGLPWDASSFMRQACNSGHPQATTFELPADLENAIEKHFEWSDDQLAKYRLDWCKRWLTRAAALEQAEEADRLSRPAHVSW